VPRLAADEIERFIAAHFAAAHGFAKIEAITDELVRVRLAFHERYLRPGGRISGPTLMTLADTAMYYAVLAELGAIRDTFTVSLEIHFLRACAARDVIAEARILKLGRNLAFGTVEMRNDGDPAIVAHATCTYSIPPERAA
jgi:uncharacterized protein (TIGR00369 family)